MVAALEQVWEAIRTRHPEVPQAVVILGAGSIGIRKGELRFGHFAAMRWHHAPPATGTHQHQPEPGFGTGRGGSASPLPEVFVGGEGLTRGPGPVLSTLLHEAAHALAAVRGIKDTSRQGRYHNERFAALATEVGISVIKDPRIGWSPSTLTDAATADYAEVIDLLGRALPLHRSLEGGGMWIPGGPGANGDPGDGGDAGDGDGAGDGAGDGGDGPSGPAKGPVAALCRCPRRVRVTRSILDAGPILCGICQAEFRAGSGTDQPDPGPEPTAGGSGPDDADERDDEPDQTGPGDHDDD